MTLQEVLDLIDRMKPAPQPDISGLLSALQQPQQQSQAADGFAQEMAAYHEQMHNRGVRAAQQAAQPHVTAGAVKPFQPADWTKAAPRSQQLDSGPLVGGPPMLLDRDISAVTGQQGLMGAEPAMVQRHDVPPSPQPRPHNAPQTPIGELVDLRPQPYAPTRYFQMPLGLLSG